MSRPLQSTAVMSRLMNGEDGIVASMLASNDGKMIGAVHEGDPSITLEPLLSRYIEHAKELGEIKKVESEHFTTFKKQVLKFEQSEHVQSKQNEEEIEELTTRKNAIKNHHAQLASEIDSIRPQIAQHLENLLKKTYQKTTNKVVYNRKKIEGTVNKLYDVSSSVVLNIDKAYRDFERTLVPFINELSQHIYPIYQQELNELEDANQAQGEEYESYIDAINSIRRYYSRYEAIESQYRTHKESLTFEDMERLIVDGNRIFEFEMNQPDFDLSPMTLLHKENYIERNNEQVYRLIQPFYNMDFSKVDNETIEEVLDAFAKCSTKFNRDNYLSTIEDTQLVKVYPSSYEEIIKEITSLLRESNIDKIKQGITKIEDTFPKESVILQETSELSKMLDEFSKEIKDYKKVSDDLKKALAKEETGFTKQDEATLDNLQSLLQGMNMTQILKKSNQGFLSELSTYDNFIKNQMNIEPYRMSDEMIDIEKVLSSEREILLSNITEALRATHNLWGRARVIPYINHARKTLQKLRRAIRDSYGVVSLSRWQNELQSDIDDIEHTVKSTYWQLGGKPKNTTNLSQK